MTDPGPIPAGKSCGDCARLDRCRMEHWQDPQSLICRHDPPLFMERKRVMLPAGQRFLADLPVSPVRDGFDPEPEPDCERCEDGGYVLSSYQGHGGPNFEICPDCHNPKGLPCP